MPGWRCGPLLQRVEVKRVGGDMQYHQMTQAGITAFEAEITALKQQRPQRIRRLAEAAALGDRSENAEYTAAKRDLRQLEGRLRYLDKLLRYAELASPPSGETVEIGTTITLRFGPDEIEVYTVVGPKESGLNENYLASDSPLGAAVLHQQAGAEVAVFAPAGRYSVTIVAISIAPE